MILVPMRYFTDIPGPSSPEIKFSIAHLQVPFTTYMSPCATAHHPHIEVEEEALVLDIRPSRLLDRAINSDSVPVTRNFYFLALWITIRRKIIDKNALLISIQK
jgi:hypothetical protein